MKTLSQIRQEYAQSKGHSDWQTLKKEYGYGLPDTFHGEVAKLYAHSMVEKFKQELLDKCDITYNNHERDITESQIKESKIELI